MMMHSFMMDYSGQEGDIFVKRNDDGIMDEYGRLGGWMASRSEGDILVILVLSVLIGPGVSLQKILHSLPDSHVGVKRSFNGLPRERIRPAILLQMLLDGLALVRLPTVRRDWILHKLQSNPASEVVRNAEDRLLIRCLKESLHLELLCLQGQVLILIEIGLHDRGGTLYSSAALMRELRTSWKRRQKSNFLARQMYRLISFSSSIFLPPFRVRALVRRVMPFSTLRTESSCLPNSANACPHSRWPRMLVGSISTAYWASLSANSSLPIFLRDWARLLKQML